MKNILMKDQVRMKSEINWQQIIYTIGIVLLLGLATWMIVSQVTTMQSQGKLVAAKAAFEEQTGIRVVRIAITGGGGIVDLQYQVVDPDKALIVHDSEKPPLMIDEKHNLIFANPFHEHAARELHTAVTYHEMIMNGAGLIQRGSKISLVVGDSKLENVIVE